MVLPGSSIGRYLVKRKLAEGGMAELYLCTAVGPEGFEKEVVIKRIKAFLSNDQTFIEMFKAEARLASRLNHANVVQIFDFDKHDDAWFIAMEYVNGASVWELRRRCRELAVPLPWTLVAEIGAQTARGLHYAHTLTDKGKPLALVHRDVTPHNVLLSFDGAVKLTDFGIAKAGTSFTAPGMLKGKFAYMSPEQARGEKVDSRTDVFALGITLWEMLTGGRLFEGDSDIAVLRAVQESLIAPPSRLNPEVPAELSELVLKALARQLDERFQTAQELERALATFILENAASPDDTNVGLFLRLMFRDELEAAERALSAEHPPAPGQSQQTPVLDSYALGNTVPTGHLPDAQTQTATPAPSAVEKPKTAQMPGIRPSRPLKPLMDEPSEQRTDRMQEFTGEPKPKTAQMPGVRPSRKVVPLEPELPLPATTPGRPLAQVQAAEPQPVPAKKSLLPWIIAFCLSLGLLAGLGFAIFKTERLSPPVPVAVVRPPPLTPAPVEPPAVVDVKPPEPETVNSVEAVPAQAAADAGPVEVAKPKGTLVIDARPYAEVWIDGRKLGEVTGTKSVLLPAGVHFLKLEHPRKRETPSVTVKAGQSVTVSFDPLH